MTEKEINPKDYKHEWTKKPKSEWTEQDHKENSHYYQTRKPIRFQFGHDATEKGVDDFLDKVFGSESEKNNKEKIDNMDDNLDNENSENTEENNNN